MSHKFCIDWEPTKGHLTHKCSLSKPRVVVSVRATSAAIPSRGDGTNCIPRDSFALPLSGKASLSCHDYNRKTKITENICVQTGYIFLFAGCNSMLAGFDLFVTRKIKRNKRQALSACDMTLKVPQEGTSTTLCSSDISCHSPGQPFHTQGGGIVSTDP